MIHDINQYESINDILLNLGNKLRLKLIVKLAGKDKDGNRIPFLQQYRYTNNNYKEPYNVISLTRNFSYYLVIDTSKFENNIMLTDGDFLLFKTKIKEMYNWINNTKIYITKNNQLSINNTSKDEILMSINDKKLLFRPAITDDGNEGIYMSINDEPETSTIFNNKILLSILSITDNLNLYTAATNLLNFMTSKDIYNININEFGRNSSVYMDRPGINNNGFFK